MVGENDKCKSYVYNKNNWEEVSGKFSINEYELMKTAVIQLSDYNQAQIEQAKNKIIKFREQNPAQYYMMLNRDYNYYTLFNYDKNNTNPKDKFEEAVMDCILVQGKVKAVDFKDKTDKIEFWVQTDEETCSVGYVFPYDEGVVNFH